MNNEEEYDFSVGLVFVDKPDMDIILDMLREYRQDLQNMRDDQHAWNEVQIKGNEQMWEDEMAMTEKLLAKYG